jgi:hypothetical protein
MRSTGILLIALFLSVMHSTAQEVEYLAKAQLAVDAEQHRIDFYDGVVNHKIKLSSLKQSLEASEIYFDKVDKIQSIIRKSSLSNLEKKDQLQELRQALEKIDKSNYYLYTSFSRQFYLIERIQTTRSSSRLKAILRANLKTSLELIPFFSNKPYAEDVLRYAAGKMPSELLKHYEDFRHADYRFRVLNEVANQAPLYLSYYYGTRNPIYLELRDISGHMYLDNMKAVFKQVGSTSKAFLLNHEILAGELTIAQAHNITRSKSRMFKHLIELSKRKDLRARYSINEELKYLARGTVFIVNELHEASDIARFKVVDTSEMNSGELYVLMVYGEQDVYTSSFLGLFKRMMDRMEEESSYVFLHNMGMNKFRTFIKECAAYNTLDEFVHKMSEWERKALFTKLVDGLEDENTNLELAVTIADIYGTLKTQTDKEKLKASLKKVYRDRKWQNLEGQKLYLLLEMLVSKDANTWELESNMGSLRTLQMDELFKGEKNLQQHFFYDDEDGWSSYASFIYSFKRKPAHWSISDKGNYVIIKSKVGNKIEIYANKARKEYDGLEELEALFKTKERFPDVVVHRGHSYYAEQTINSITPSAGVVILGSCGGYTNVLQVLQQSPDAAIVASKQVGTKHVNNELIYQFNEALRTGDGKDWDAIWKKVETRVKSNVTASRRFKDYIPPHKNMGAIIIREYKSVL